METFKITEAVPVQRVYDMLVSAFEGGSNYWYMLEERIEPPMPYTFTDKMWNDKREADPTWIHSLEIPFNEGGALLLSDEQADEPRITEAKDFFRLDSAALEKGLQTMARDHREHYADFLKENDDAITADVFLQCCVFGDVIYG